MTTLDDTRHCPMCEDSAKKILELEQRVNVLTGAVIAAAEDGYLCHGPEGMDDVQTKLYEAYLLVKPRLPKESKE